MFPVAISHAARDIPGPRELPDAMARAVRAALAQHDGDILAFLPGMAEIRRTQAALEGCGALVLPLHGDLPPAEQDRALRPAEGRRVVLATSIAETSLTVPGVRIVVDGGWRRAPRLDPSTGLTRLATCGFRARRPSSEPAAPDARRRVSRSGCGPRRCIADWPPFDRPEILEAELSSLVLDCAAWGAAPARSGVPRSAAAGRIGRGGGAARRNSARSMRRGASPKPAGAWPRSARIRGWPR